MRLVTKADIDYTTLEEREDGLHLVVVLKNVEYKEVPDEKVSGGSP